MIGLASATRSTSSGQIGQRESTTGNPSWSSDQQIPPNSTQQEKAKKTVDFGFQQVSPEEKSEKGEYKLVIELSGDNRLID